MNEDLSLNEYGKIFCQKIDLLKKHELSLILVFHRSDISNTGKKYLLDVQFFCDGIRVSGNYSEAILIKESFWSFVNRLFVEGDENEYLKYSVRTVDNIKRVSVLCKFASKKLFLSRWDAKTICTIWNQAMQGYSFQKLLEREPTREITVSDVEIKLLLTKNNKYCPFPTVQEVLSDDSYLNDLFVQK